MVVLPLSSCAPNSGTLLFWQAPASSEYTLSCHKLASADCLCTTNPSPFPGSDLWASSPHLHQQRSISVWRTQGGGADLLCRLLSILPYANQLLCSPPRLWSSLSIQADPPPVKGLPGCGNLFSFTAPSLWCRPVPIPFYFLLSYPVLGGFLVFSEVWGLLLAFSRCSMWIVPLADVFWMFLWE